MLNRICNLDWSLQLLSFKKCFKSRFNLLDACTAWQMMYESQSEQMNQISD
jgi:hypothetical protein